MKKNICQISSSLFIVKTKTFQNDAKLALVLCWFLWCWFSGHIYVKLNTWILHFWFLFLQKPDIENDFSMIKLRFFFFSWKVSVKSLKVAPKEDQTAWKSPFGVGVLWNEVYLSVPQIDFFGKSSHKLTWKWSSHGSRGICLLPGIFLFVANTAIETARWRVFRFF